MKNILISILMVSFLLPSLILSQDQSDGFCKIPGRVISQNHVNYPGDQNIDVTYYKLDLNINYIQSFLNGAVTIDFMVLSEGTTDFFFDLQNTFTVDSIIFSGPEIQFQHSVNKINLQSSAQLTTGTKYSCVIYYHGTPGSSGFGSFEFSTHNSGTKPAIWTLSEPYGASDWWPCKDTPADKADSSEVRVRADSVFYTVSNGKLTEIITHDDGTKTFIWKNKYPIAQYLISLAMTNYYIYETEYTYGNGQTMPVIHYMYPEKWNAARKVNVDRTLNMITIFSELFGPYPFLEEKYGHAEFGWGGGMEHQTVSSMGTFSESVVAHELAHQWYGDKVTCIDWHNIWLNEGFASYAEALYFEALYGRDSYINYVSNQMGTSTNPFSAKGAVGSLYCQDISSVNSIFDYARSYLKGSIVLHMLRGVVGDEDFFTILKAYAADPELGYGVASTEDFQRVCEEISGLELDYFFQEWVYGVKYPKYNIDWGYSTNGSNIYDVRVTLSQTANSNPLYFTMPVDLKIITAIGDTTFRIFNDQQIQDFNFVVNGKPSAMLFDPDKWIMKDVNSTTGLTDFELMPDEFRIIGNYPNPFNPTTTISYYTTEAGNIRISLYDISGALISVLEEGYKPSGLHKYEFNSAALPIIPGSGVYFYSIGNGKKILTAKMTLLK